MKKLLNYKTVMTFLAIIVVVLQILMTKFKVNINIDAVVSISIALVGVLVTIGIIKKDKTDEIIDSKEELLELLDASNEENTQNSKIELNDENINQNETLEVKDK